MADVIFSGIQPSGELHIGNYIGAVKQWVDLAKKNEAYFCIVDLHAITVEQDSEELRRRIRETAAIYLAAGIDPEKSTIFVQSDVPAHSELGWIMSTQSRVGELERMTQYKDKAAKNAKKGVPTGLLVYPPLMAADILLYGTTLVPVGEDQSQHVELTRDLARRMNKKYGEVFKVPKVRVQKVGGMIMGLDDATKKMSKSASSPANYIALTDDADTIRKKIKRAVTDSGSEVSYDPVNKPEISNLLAIFHHMSGRPVDEIAHDYVDAGYGTFKADLAEVIVEEMAPFHERLFALLESEKKLDRILEKGAKRAADRAQITLDQVKLLMGLGS